MYLKEYFMKQGNKCSLQYHDEKYETNYLIDGKAKIIKGLHIDLKEDRKKTFEIILSKDLHKRLFNSFKFTICFYEYSW